MDSAYPIPDSLGEALLRFREFLRGQGWPDQVQWLIPGTVHFSKRGHYWINSCKVEEGVALARETYQQGITQGLGISLEALCHSGSVTFAHILVPTDRDEAERLHIAGIKLSVPVNPHGARVVKNSFLWWMLDCLYELPFETFPTR